MYDPTVGRWLSQDPIGFKAGDPNLYRYVGNHPTMATDPSGLDERIVGDHTFIGKGHHKIPVSVIRQHLSWLPKNLLEFLDGSDNLICQPEGTGHNQTLHGKVEGYTRHVSDLVSEEIEAFRKELKLPADAAIPADKQDMLVRRLISSIDGQPLDTFVGGFNNAVKTGGVEGVKTWGARIKSMGGRISGFARGSSKCLGPLNVISGVTGSLVPAAEDMKKMKERGETPTWSDWWDSWWYHEIHDPIWVMPGMLNPNNPAFAPDADGRLRG